MKKRKQFIIIGAILITIIFFTIKSVNGINGKVIQVINKCGNDRPVIIMKALGVKKINSIKEIDDYETFKEWKINVDNNKIIELEYTKPEYSTGDNWSLMGNSHKKINEIDPNINDDHFAHYYYDLSEYSTNLAEDKIIKFSEIKKKVDETNISIFEKSSGLFIFLLPYLFIIGIIYPIIKTTIMVRNKKMESHNKFLKENDSSFVLKNVSYNFGIDNFIRGESCNIFIQNNNLKFVNLVNKNTASLKYSQILSCGVFTDKQIQQQAITKNGNVIGRGVLGGFIFGPAGLILGGMSGIGAKNTTVNITNVSYYFIINFKSKDSEEIKCISFKSNVFRHDFNELEKELKRHLKKQNINL